MEAVPPADREGVAKRCSNRTRRVVLTDISNQGAAVESKPSKRRISRSAPTSDDSKRQKFQSSNEQIPIERNEVPKASALPVFKVPVRLSQRLEPILCGEVVDDLYGGYYQLQEQYKVSPYISTIQTEITMKMRCILIDWLVEVHYKFKLVPQTLWMCVNILDRFLGKVPVERTKLQLAGVASLLIACKYEESGPPEVKDCIFITDYSYTRKEILAMESAILTVLDYYLCVPTGYAFLMKYVHAIGANDKLKYLAFYYGERNLQEYDTIDYLPSEYAAACLYAALVQQQQTNLNATFLLESQNIQSVPSVWTEQLVKETGLKESEIKPLASLLVEHAGEEHVTASKRLLIAARKKYSVEKYYYVSNLLQPQL